MNVRLFPDYDELSKKAAEFVLDRVTAGLAHTNRFVLGLPTGATPIGMYHELVSLIQNKPKLNLSNLFTFNLDEYYPVSHSDPESYYLFMEKEFWGPLSQINSTFDYHTQAFILNGRSATPSTECKKYEDKIASLGGMDLIILGIGTNGHIGFNEPGSLPDSRTRLIDLSPETIAVNSRKFFDGNQEAVPKQALTMGLGTIREAKELILLVSGSSKAPIMKQLLEGTEDSAIPAFHLLSHPNLTTFLDTEAAPQSVLTQATAK